MYLVACLFLTLTATAQKVIRVIPDSPDMTKGLQAAIEEARSHTVSYTHLTLPTKA